jgi:hypothetical protein
MANATEDDVKKLPEQLMYGPFFDLVKPARHWKDPIETRVEAPADTEDFRLWCELVTRAVAFYTGSVAKIAEYGGPRKPWESRRVLVQAAGYYAAIGS